MRLGVPLQAQSRTPGGSVPRWHAAAFSLVELLVVVAIIGTATLMGMPAMLNALNRAKLTGFTQTVAAAMQAARLEAIKRGGTARVEAQYATATTPDTLVAYVDLNKDGLYTKGTDVLVATAVPPSGVLFQGPGPLPAPPAAETHPGGFSSFDALAAGGGVAVFNADGSVAKTGGFRFRDRRGNIMEAFVSSLSGGRVAVRKFAGDPNGADNSTQYYESDQLAKWDAYFVGSSTNKLLGWQWR